MKKSLLSGLVLATLLIGVAAQAHELYNNSLTTVEVLRNSNGASSSTPLTLSSINNGHPTHLKVDFKCGTVGKNGASDTSVEFKDIHDDVVMTYVGCRVSGVSDIQTNAVSGTDIFSIPNDAVSLQLFSNIDNVASASTAKITVEVLGPQFPPPGNFKPQAERDRGYSGVEGQAVTVYPMANDIDADGDTLSIVRIYGVDAPNTATLNADGSVTFVGGAGYLGQDYFNYEITDGYGGFDIGSIMVEVVTP
ncbi:MAG: Ig-like domain-containing protein [Alphaproteobacteria bacterium]